MPFYVVKEEWPKGTIVLSVSAVYLTWLHFMSNYLKNSFLIVLVFAVVNCTLNHLKQPLTFIRNPLLISACMQIVTELLGGGIKPLKVNTETVNLEAFLNYLSPVVAAILF